MFPGSRLTLLVIQVFEHVIGDVLQIIEEFEGIAEVAGDVRGTPAILHEDAD